MKNELVAYMKQQDAQTEKIEQQLDEADKAAVLSDARCSENEVFSRVRQRLHEAARP